MRKATIFKLIMGAAVGVLPLLGNMANAHVSGGDYTGSCSPHNAVGSKGASFFYNCGHVQSSPNYPRDVACSLSSGCYTYGYQPNVGTCSGSKFVQGASVQTSGHALDPAWSLWTCENQKANNYSCGGTDHSGTDFNFMCLSNYCDDATNTCRGNVPNMGSCTNSYQCVTGNVCDGGYCKLKTGWQCHYAGTSTYDTCAYGEFCLRPNMKPCYSTVDCWCGGGGA